MTAALPPPPAALRQKLLEVQTQGLLQASARQAPPSPCIGVCRMDVDQHYCLGCLRTLEELCAWGSSPAAQQRAIWQQIALRCQSAPAPNPDAGGNIS